MIKTCARGSAVWCRGGGHRPLEFLYPGMNFSDAKARHHDCLASGLHRFFRNHLTPTP